MTTEELQEQGAIYFDKITDGFRDYKDVNTIANYLAGKGYLN